MIQTEKSILATDLDGTLIPLQGNHQNRTDLVTLKSKIADSDVTLVYVTGRHFGSAINAIREFELPHPNWILCDVGSSLYQFVGGAELSESYAAEENYSDHLESILPSRSLHQIGELLPPQPGLAKQEAEKQGRHKLSYYADAEDLSQLRNTIMELAEKHQFPVQVITSVDPFNNDGLIDILPKRVSKAFGLQWWTLRMQFESSQVVFAGDSGNDLAALSAGYRAIVVANASCEVVARVQAESKDEELIYLASGVATSGVLEGCQYWSIF